MRWSTAVSNRPPGICGNTLPQFDKLLDTVADKLPEVHDHLDEARADILAFTAFPKEIWRQIWSTTPTSGSTARSAAAPPTSSGSSPTAPQPSGSSASSSPNSTTTGSKAAARTRRPRPVPNRPDQHRPDHHRTGGPDTRRTHCLECSHRITRWPLHRPRPWTLTVQGGQGGWMTSGSLRRSRTVRRCRGRRPGGRAEG